MHPLCQAKSNRKYIRKMRALVKSRFEYKARIPNIGAWFTTILAHRLYVHWCRCPSTNHIYARHGAELELKNLDLESLEEGWGDALQVCTHIRACRLAIVSNHL